MTMRYFLSLVESISGFQPISSLTPEQQQIALKAFAKLADKQRGKPEILATSMNANPQMFHAMGAFTYLAEHIGDLTHRIAEKNSNSWGYGFEFVSQKVNRGLRYFENGYGIDREIQGNLKNNYQIRFEDGDFTGTFKEYVDGFKIAAKRYADAHRELIVYNEAQWHCRESAIALGDLNYDSLYSHLKVLRYHLEEGVDSWANWASLVIMHGDTIQPYNH